MNRFDALITGYSLLLLIGGVTGYMLAGSFPSLLMSSICAILLIGSLFLRAYKTIYAVLVVLALFFGYRWYMGAFLPPGALCILSLVILGIGYFFRRKVRA